jgi:hypothetical protein
MIPGLRRPALEALTDKNRVRLVREPVKVRFADVHLAADRLL